MGRRKKSKGGAKRRRADEYLTPPDAIEALRRRLLDPRPLPGEGEASIHGKLRARGAWDPCAGPGALCRGLPLYDWTAWELQERFRRPLLGYASSVEIGDTLAREDWPERPVIVTNPPFSRIGDFLTRVYAAERAAIVLLPINWLREKSRSWARAVPPAWELALPWRLSFTADGKSDRAHYSWFCWPGGESTGRTVTIWPDRPEARKEDIRWHRRWALRAGAVHAPIDHTLFQLDLWRHEHVQTQ